ncbi:class A beta-lactamase [Nitratireductor thuwali]|uniref:Beta-lactamase n=1 Tax=Nitratireductor thuwali TaxID=2267699 RepID=A0ABY5ML68_9HYPH|nr:Beta-lactamase CTX-M-1 [Nitratireductor thuwali]
MVWISRRQALVGSMLMASATTVLPGGAAAKAVEDVSQQLADLESRHGGRLGVAILEMSSGARSGHRENERFLMCSTFKALLAAHILARVDRQEDRLDRRIVISEADLVPWAPITETRIGGDGMTIAELCEAVVTMSDNVAANLLLAASGGPAALTGYARSLGDEVTRLDRIEPALNEHDGPDDARDTTSPAAMLETLRTLIFGEALSRASRDQLSAWLITNKTGDERLRAGMPAEWMVGDKTGTNRSGNANDIGFGWPNDRAPFIVTSYCDMPNASADERNSVIAEVGRIAAGG